MLSAPQTPSWILGVGVGKGGEGKGGGERKGRKGSEGKRERKEEGRGHPNKKAGYGPGDLSVRDKRGRWSILPMNLGRTVSEPTYPVATKDT